MSSASAKLTGKKFETMSEQEQEEAASRPDEENPLWTLEEMRRARPAYEVFAEIYGPEFVERLKQRGRPVKPNKKVNQTLRLDPDVLEAFKREGSGWQARINQVLREHMPKLP
jgi:uncharacterized protein (DUF4415 family)